MIDGRKSDHIEICASKDVAARYNYWDDVALVHDALPEVDFDAIDTSASFMGKRLSAPIIVAAITGGTPEAEKINRNLAEAASELGLGMGVGSQRPAIEDSSKARTYEVVKDFKVPFMLANVGAPQLVAQKGRRALEPADIKKCMDMVRADAVAVHLNFLQELTQPEGDLSSKGCLEAIRRIAGEFPVVAKETGGGISSDAALELKRARVVAIDVGGMGGTSFAAVEHYRAESSDSKLHARLGKTFWDWGIPTPVTLVQADVGLPLIATGGVRNGLDVARAITLGASCAGMARSLLRPAMESADAVKKEMAAAIAELRGAMMLTGSDSIDSLASKGFLVTGRTKEWMDQL